MAIYLESRRKSLRSCFCDRGVSLLFVWQKQLVFATGSRVCCQIQTGQTENRNEGKQYVCLDVIKHWDTDGQKFTW